MREEERVISPAQLLVRARQAVAAG